MDGLPADLAEITESNDTLTDPDVRACITEEMETEISGQL